MSCITKDLVFINSRKPKSVMGAAKGGEMELKKEEREREQCSSVYVMILTRRRNVLGETDR